LYHTATAFIQLSEALLENIAPDRVAHRLASLLITGKAAILMLGAAGQQ
jgi:hypothetical protein